METITLPEKKKFSIFVDTGVSYFARSLLLVWLALNLIFSQQSLFKSFERGEHGELPNIGSTPFSLIIIPLGIIAFSLFLYSIRFLHEFFIRQDRNAKVVLVILGVIFAEILQMLAVGFLLGAIVLVAFIPFLPYIIGVFLFWYAYRLFKTGWNQRTVNTRLK